MDVHLPPFLLGQEFLALVDPLLQPDDDLLQPGLLLRLGIEGVDAVPVGVEGGQGGHGVDEGLPGQGLLGVPVGLLDGLFHPDGQLGFARQEIVVPAEAGSPFPHVPGQVQPLARRQNLVGLLHPLLELGQGFPVRDFLLQLADEHRGRLDLQQGLQFQPGQLEIVLVQQLEGVVVVLLEQGLLVEALLLGLHLAEAGEELGVLLVDLVVLLQHAEGFLHLSVLHLGPGLRKQLLDGQPFPRLHLRRHQGQRLAGNRDVGQGAGNLDRGRLRGPARIQGALHRLGHLQHGGVAVLPVLAQTPQDDLLDFGRAIVPDVPGRHRRVLHDRVDRGGYILFDERLDTRHKLVQDDAHRILVGPPVHLLPHDLFRGHVADGPQQHPGLGQRGGNHVGHAEVEDLDGVVGADEHVGGLDVAVHHVVGVRVVQPVGSLGADLQDAGKGKGFLLLEEGFEVRPLQQFHDDVGSAPLLAQVVDGDDVHMVEVGRGAGLHVKPLAEVGVVGELAGHGLDGHFPVQDRVEGLVDDAHGAPADDPVQIVFAQCLKFHGSFTALNFLCIIGDRTAPDNPKDSSPRDGAGFGATRRPPAGRLRVRHCTDGRL